MNRSVLLQLARDSIQKVLQANRSIDKALLINKHPLLSEKDSALLKTTNFSLENELGN